MDQKLFRQKSVDRISSPEQLNDYLRVTSPAVWIILLAVMLLLAGLLIWSSTAVIESYVEGAAEVKDSMMTIRFTDQNLAKNIQEGMTVSVGDHECAVATVGRDSNGLIIATAHTALPDGFYPVKVCYKQKQVMDLLFN